jgi:hypothetical protein
LTLANGRLFALFGSTLYEYSSTGVSTARGSVAQDSHPGQFAFNGVVGGHLGVCSGGNVYNLDLTTNTLSAALLTGGYTHLAYADGYGLAFNPTTGKVQLSGLDDLSTWNIGTFFRRSKFPDPWQAMFVDPSGLAWMVGYDTFEVWSLSNPASTQPFAPLSGLLGAFGIAAPFAYGVSGLGMQWLSRSTAGGATVVSTRGSVPQLVSSYAVNTAIGNYRRSTTISDAEMLVYSDDGHTFANVAFPSAAATWSYDLEGQSWAERGKWNSAAGRYDLWAPRCHVDAFGKHIVGDRSTGVLYTMDTALNTEIDGTGIRRLRRTPGFTDEHKREPIDQLELLMDTGVAGQGIDPQALLRVSVDGGRTFGNERRASTGRVGEYRKRVYWTRMGAPEDCVVEVVWSDVAPTRVIGAWLNNAEQAA